MTFSNRILQFAQKSEFVIEANQARLEHELVSWQQVRIEEYQFGIGWACDWEKGSFQLLISSESKLNQLDKAYLEAFCHLSRSLNFNKINLISYRDLENYLRDENHLEAHSRDYEHQILAINWIESFKKALMKPLFRHFFDSVLVESGPLSSPTMIFSCVDLINHKIKNQSRLGEHFFKSEIIALIPQRNALLRYEIQWRFHPEIEPDMAQALCSALEDSLSNQSIVVKVVAESSGAELS